MLIKLLLLAAIAYGVWYFWRKYITVGPKHDGVGTRGKRGGRAAAHIEDMAQCPVCGIYVGASAAACGRQDCPRRG